MTLSIYARREPTTDRVALEHVTPKQRAQEFNKWSDVVFYADAEAKQCRGRIPCWYGCQTLTFTDFSRKITV